MCEHLIAFIYEFAIYILIYILSNTLFVRVEFDITLLKFLFFYSNSALLLKHTCKNIKKHEINYFTHRCCWCVNARKVNNIACVNSQALKRSHI